MSAWLLTGLEAELARGPLAHFRPQRHLMTAGRYRFEMNVRFTIWNRITGLVGMPATGTVTL
ncbi:hypothetical protein [Streptomyces sp. NBC_01264]|uniref:hypothetical protein n=1 Tax=Streptomyces sp. NBC_01264 TaxID=2903804 RepID=UPI00224E8A08|nr:hypothetical protein [Streptomyces sp. NBC_01264]MCX4784393.1 hypothetical protein [Streptomyces sp. NBC_01264]